MFLDKDIYTSLEWVANHNNVDTLCLDFTVHGTELKPDGENIELTDDNKEEYLHLVLRYYMLDSISDQLESIMKGVQDIICINALKVFDYQQLDLFLCGKKN